MIRNNAGGSAVRDTAKLIETLKKVGVIKTKKRRARRSLAKDEIRQDNDMGPGFAETLPGFTGPSGLNLVERNFPQLTMGPRPLLGGGGDQQGGFNPAQIEDLKRNQIQQFGLLQDRLEKQAQEQEMIKQYGGFIGSTVFDLRKRLERGPAESGTADPFANVKGSGDAVESAQEEGQESDDQEMEKVGPNANISEDVKTTTAGAGFVNEEPNVFPSVKPASPPPAIASASTPPEPKAPPSRAFLSKKVTTALDAIQIPYGGQTDVKTLLTVLQKYAQETGRTSIPTEAQIRAEQRAGEDFKATLKRVITRLVKEDEE
jgi:hypothetical protein